MMVTLKGGPCDGMEINAKANDIWIAEHNAIYTKSDELGFIYLGTAHSKRPTSWFRRMIVRAAPTCTLWVQDVANMDVWRFRFHKAWKITAQEYVENRQ